MCQREIPGGGDTSWLLRKEDEFAKETAPEAVQACSGRGRAHRQVLRLYVFGELQLLRYDQSVITVKDGIMWQDVRLDGRQSWRLPIPYFWGWLYLGPLGDLSWSSAHWPNIVQPGERFSRHLCFKCRWTFFLSFFIHLSLTILEIILSPPCTSRKVRSNSKERLKIGSNF